MMSKSKMAKGLLAFFIASSFTGYATAEQGKAVIQMSESRFKEMLIESLFDKDLSAYKKTLTDNGRANAIHQGNLTADELKAILKIAEAQADEDISKRSGGVITKRMYLDDIKKTLANLGK